MEVGVRAERSCGSGIAFDLRAGAPARGGVHSGASLLAIREPGGALSALRKYAAAGKRSEYRVRIYLRFRRRHSGKWHSRVRAHESARIARYAWYARAAPLSAKRRERNFDSRSFRREFRLVNGA